jgi:Protein of unknown function (DUF2752)
MTFYFLNIIDWLQAHQLPCMFKSITHFDCPGCGLQTSLLLLLRGNVIDSFKTYPALLPIIVLFAFLSFHLVKKTNNGAAVLKYLYFFCAGIIVLSYIYKLIAVKPV